MTRSLERRALTSCGMSKETDRERESVCVKDTETELRDQVKFCFPCRDDSEKLRLLKFALP